MNVRRLSLRRERLAELRADELAAAAAGRVPPTYDPGCSLPVQGCLSLKPHCSWSCPAV